MRGNLWSDVPPTPTEDARARQMLCDAGFTGFVCTGSQGLTVKTAEQLIAKAQAAKDRVKQRRAAEQTA